MNTSSTGGIRSVHKAIDILEVLSTTPSGTGLRELAQLIGQNESTTHHLVSTLKDRGFIRQAESTRVYSLGTRLIQIALSEISSMDLMMSGTKEASRLRDETGETTYLNDFRLDRPMTLVQLSGWHPLQARNAVNPSDQSLHCTATGKLFLAYLPDQRRDQVLDSIEFVRYTENTIMDRSALIQELKKVRSVGHALDLEEHRVSIACIEAPIFEFSGLCIGGISTSFATSNQSQVGPLIERVIEAANNVSQSLGNGLSKLGS